MAHKYSSLRNQFLLRLLLLCLMCFYTNFSSAQENNTSNENNQPSTEDYSTHVVNQINQLMTEMKKLADDGKPKCDLSKTDKCEMANLCDTISANRNKLYIYENSKGEKVPNISLYQILNWLPNCTSANTGYGNNSNLGVGVGDDVVKDKMKKRKLFLQSIKENKEEGILRDLEEAMLDEALKSTQTGMLDYSRDGLKQQMENAEIRSGRKLSDKSKNLWIASLEMINTYSANPSAIDKTIFGFESDPFIDLNLLTSPKAAGNKDDVLRNQAVFQAELNRAYRTYKEAQQIIVEVLETRKNETNRDAINYQIERVKSVKMALPPLVGQNENNAACSSPNAYYNPSTHEFMLCAQVLAIPTASMMELIAHELGHSIDPCSLSYPFIKIENNPNAPNYTMLTNVQNVSSDYVPFTPTLPDQGKESYLVNSSDAFQPPTFMSEIQKGIDYDKFPLASVTKCLASDESVKARLGNSEAAKKEIQDYLNMLKRSGATEKDEEYISYSKLLAKMNKADYEGHRACPDLPGDSQMNEAFADWMANEVIAKKILSLPESERKTAAYEAGLFHISLGCRNFVPDIKESIAKNLKDLPCMNRNQFQYNTDNDQLGMVERILFDSHPLTPDRVDSLIYSQPTIRAAMGCKGKGAKYCE